MNRFLFTIGRIIGIVLIFAIGVFLVSLMRLQILPTEYLIAVCVLLLGLAALVLMLAWIGKRKINAIISIILAMVLLMASFTGSIFIRKALLTFESILNDGTETVHIGIYVYSDDTDDDHIITADSCYGVLQQQDRESADVVIHQIAQKFGAEPAIQEYQKLPELIDGLLNKQVDAIILNQAYLELLEEMDGYEDILHKIHEVELKQVSVEVEIESTKPNTPENIVPSGEIKPFGIYISGIDTRGSVSVRSRSDVNILAVVNPATRQIALVSTPRDYFVPLSISNGVPDKLTHAGVYGINVSKDTLQMLYGVEIDYYFRINFSGFEKMIDALGGITIHSEYAFKAGKGKYSFQKGENAVDGKAALAFCRERYSLPGGDRQRGKHQMAVIQGVIKKALSPALLQNYTAVLKAVEGSFETDMPMELIGALASRQIKEKGEWSVTTCSADGRGDYQIPYSMSVKAYVMQPDYETVERAKSLLLSVKNGENAN